MEILDLMKELGMSEAVKATEKRLDMDRRLHLAYQNFDFVRREAVDSFNKKLKEKTTTVYDPQTGKTRKKIDPKQMNQVVFDQLVFCVLSAYKSVPPLNVLQEVKRVADMNVFNTFSVASIKSVVEIVDPIVFGHIDGCSDLFFVTQWDEDIKFDQLREEARKL